MSEFDGDTTKQAKTARRINVVFPQLDEGEPHLDITLEEGVNPISSWSVVTKTFHLRRDLLQARFPSRLESLFVRACSGG